ncbi:MAG: LysR family transcriptional regulator [Neisseriales bacterium]|nr:MAG: LysR family transcriptional regulator [Neisseriales bacterium]
MITECLEDLVYFAAIIKEANFSKAAKSLDVSQLTLRRFIQKLEAQLEHRLIQTGQTNFVLTEYAHNLMSQLAPQLKAMEHEMFNLIQNDLNYHSTIKIALPHFVADMIMPHLLGKFCCEYPHIQLEFAYINLLNYFEPNLLDYDLMFLGCIPNNSQFYITKFGKLRAKLYCSRVYADKYGIPHTLEVLNKEHRSRLVSFMHKAIKITNLNDESDSLFIANTRLNSGTVAAQAYIDTNEFITFSVCHGQLGNAPNVIPLLTDYYVEEFDFCLLKNRNSNLHAVQLVQNILVNLVVKNMRQVTGNLFMDDI